MPVRARLWASPTGTKNTGLGGGPFLRQRQFMTADDIHVDGVSWMRPWDMVNDFGAPGAAIASAKGKRFCWFVSADHWASTYGWTRGGGCWQAWTDQPGIPPSPGDWQLTIPVSVTADTFNFTQMETPWPVYNPDDPSNPFHLYAHGVNINGQGQTTIVYRSSDFETWTAEGRSHQAPYFGGHVGYQRVFRTGVNTWESVGLGFATLADAQALAKVARWTSSDGLDFTIDASHSNMDQSSGGINFGVVGEASPDITVGGQKYIIGREDDRPNGGGQYVSLIPIDSFRGLDTANIASKVRLSDKFGGVYPGPTYLQGASNFVLDGVFYIFPQRAFFSDTGLIDGASYENGGGYDDELIDVYTGTVPGLETQAASSAPVRLRASCSGGVVTLNWDDALPHKNYRIRRGTSFGTYGTSLGDISAVTITDSPTVGSVYYYQVTTLNGGVEAGSHVVSTYVS